MKLPKILCSLQEKIFTIIGDIKIYKYPMFMIYDPVGYKLKSRHFLEVINKIKPFDILLRRFDAYLDNGFIPGFWNHGAVYIGDEQTVIESNIIHAIAEGVVYEKLFDFMKADYVTILRPKFEFDPNKLIRKSENALGKKYDFSFNFESQEKFSCTELVQYMFKDYVKFQIDEFLGKPIIKPDTIYYHNQFEIVYDSSKEKSK